MRQSKLAMAMEQLEVGQVVEGRHRLVERIARGAMGEVFVAVDELTGRRVALKRMRDKALASPSAVEHFRAEYRALRALDHPRIIEVYHYGLDGELPYYTMELLDGEDLRKLAPLPYREACRYLRDVASSIALLHARRLLHRDLTPRNVRRTSDGRCKLIDFGTMTPFGLPPNVAGTAPFLPPEALEGAELDQRADLYSLGALAYWLLTGHHAYDARNFDELPERWTQPPPRTRRHDDGIPKELDDLVLSLLEPNPMGRPASAAEVIERLNSLAQLPDESTPELAASYLTRTAFVGHEPERALIEKRLARAALGRGSTLLVHGLTGVGKSRLLQDAALIAQTHGLLSVTASAREVQGERAVATTLLEALQAAAPIEARTAIELHRQTIDELREGAQHRRADRAELRARLLKALGSIFTAIAEARPLLLAVDDLDQADEFSIAFVAALGVEAERVPIVVMASSGRDRDEVAIDNFDSFAQSAQRIVLAPLDADQTVQLVASSFGAVPNVERVASWIFRNARGNPAMSIELIRHLADRGLARYASGSWVLPDLRIDEEVPQELRRALALRLSRISPQALQIARLVALHGSSASATLIETASPLPVERTRAALQELTAQDVLTPTSEGFSFKLEAMREAVQLDLDPHDRRELHGLLATALLTLAGDDDPYKRLLGGWHLSHTLDELRGAEILARVSPQMLRAGDDPRRAAAAMERALEILERHHRPLAHRLRLRSYLALAGYLCDPKLALRYGEQTVRQLYEATGLARADRWSRWLGKRLAVSASMLWTALSRFFIPAERRPPSPDRSLIYFGRAITSLSGVRATMLDGPGTAALLPMVDALAASGIPVAAQAAMTCQALALQPRGREGELRRLLDETLRQLDSATYRWIPGLDSRDVDDLRVGLLLPIGINEAYRADSRALELADEIDAVSAQLSTVCAERVRMVFYTVRGRREEAERSRRLLELHGIQGGTTWQVNAFSKPVEGMAAAILGDVVACRRALDQIERMITETPSLIPMRDLVLAGYHFARGDYGQAVEVGRALIAEHPPNQLIGWGPAHAVTVASLLELGRYEEARDLARTAYEAIPEGDLVYATMYLALQGSLAVAEGLTGNVEAAERIFDEIEGTLSVEREPSAVALAHHYRTLLARKLGDRDKLLTSLRAMTQLAHSSRDPVLIAHVDRITGLSTRMTVGSDRPQSVGAGDDASAETTVRGGSEETLVTRVLDHYRGDDERAVHALRVIAQCAGAVRGYLFAEGRRGPAVLAQLDGDDPPPELEEKLGQLLTHGRPGTQGRVQLSDREGPARTYLVVVLRGDGNGGERSGVIALEEQSDQLLKLRPALIDQVGKSLVAHA